MIRKLVTMRGLPRTEGPSSQGHEYQWSGQLLMFHGKVKQGDIVVVDTYDNGALAERDTYVCADTSASTPFRWTDKSTMRFRDEDLGRGL